MVSAVLNLLRRTRSDESGQSLVIVGLAMVVMLGMAAMAVDVSSWYVKHHQAQVVADSAALAAANCLANPNTGSTSTTDGGPQCTSATDTADATKVAENYASANGVSISAGNISYSGSTVTISATNTSAPPFSSVLGVTNASQSAGASASWSSSSKACTTTSQSAGLCYAIYAANQTCGSSDGLYTSSTYDDITGAIHSDGSMSVGNGTFDFQGPVTYNSGGCTYTAQQNGTETGKYAPTAGGNEAGSNNPPIFWPTDYTKIFTACGPTATYQCTTVQGVSGLPSYCTDVAGASGFLFGWNNNGTEPQPGHVYCSVGTGTPGNPATWNGGIVFNDGANAGSSSTPVDASFLGGYVSTTSSTLDLTPAPTMDGCEMYVTDTDSAATSALGSTTTALDVQNGSYNIGGTIFSPAGTIDIGSTGGAAAFIEGMNVDLTNLSFDGDGPTVSTSGGEATSGTDSLTN